MEDPLRFPLGKVPELPPKNFPLEVIEAWRAELRLGLQRRGLLEKLLADPSRVPHGSRFRLLD